MKTIEYIAPAIEVIEMEIQDVIAVSPGAIADPTINDDPTRQELLGRLRRTRCL